MRTAKLALIAGAFLAAAVPAVTSASAEMVRKSVTVREGHFGRGCRTVRVVKQGFGGRRVIVKKVCG